MSAREKAIALLTLGADMLGRFEDGEAEAMCTGYGGVRLAQAAHSQVTRWHKPYDFHTTYLEAAALLRDGWSPGDPVAKRNRGRRRW